MADRKYSDFSTQSSLERDDAAKAVGFSSHQKPNYTRAIIIGIVCGVVVGGAIGSAVAFAIRSSRSS